MIYVYYLLVFTAIFISINGLLRYFYYLKIKKNFKALTSTYQGTIQQNQVFAYPIFNGIYKNKSFKITLSQDVLNKKKVVYISISIATNSKYKLTILSKYWLQLMNENVEKDSFSDELFTYRLNSKKDQNFFLNNKAIQQMLEKFLPFSYIVINNDSVLIELFPNNLSKYLKKEALIGQLNTIFSFLDALK